MFKDKLLLAGIAGLIGTLASAVVDYLCFLLNITHTTTAHFIAGIIFSSLHLTLAELIVGQISHLIAGAVVGIIALLIYLWSGKNYPLIKGASIGAGMWLSHVVLVTSFVAGRIREVPTISSLYVELFSLILWGVITYMIIAKYGAGIEN